MFKVTVTRYGSCLHLFYFNNQIFYHLVPIRSTYNLITSCLSDENLRSKCQSNNAGKRKQHICLRTEFYAIFLAVIVSNFFL